MDKYTMRRMVRAVALRAIATEEYFGIIRAQLEAGGQAFVRVTGTSMAPLLRHLRDGVIIERPGRIRVGDVVLFDRKNGRYALHRVIRVRGDSFSMMGDHQGHMEDGLPVSQILGCVSCFQRGERRWKSDGMAMRLYAWLMVCSAWPRRLAGFIVRRIRRSRA